MQRISLISLLVIIAILCSSLAGCVGPQGEANGAGISVANSTHNFARQDDASWETAIAGPFPTNAVIDSDGANVQTGGPNTVLGLLLPQDVKLFTSNPADTRFARLTYTAGDGSTIEIEGFESSKSSVIAAYDQQVLVWAQAQQVITQEQAAVAAKLVEGGMSAIEAITTVLGGL